MVLPLHQRVALLQQAQPELSKKDAVQKAMASVQTHGEGGAQPSAAMGFQASVLSVQTGTNGSVLAVLPTCGLRSFEFGHVFDGSTTQSNVYERCGLRLVTDLVNGVNGALILFGQTGSGKTHTMFGPQNNEQESERGLALRIADAVLATLPERRKLGLEVGLRLSYVEIFGNEVVDLLGEQKFDEPSVSRHVIEGGLEVPIDSHSNLLDALARGETRKRCASTAMNERSTRAHTLLIFRLLQTWPGADRPAVVSQLFLADLGGSERVTKSRANESAKTAGFVPWGEYYDSRKRLTETNHINQGLLALKRCITALGERQQRRPGAKAPPVPFRDSRLTAVLEPALGGLARTAVVLCCSPDADHAEETVQTLRFGEMCSRIEHVQRVKQDPSSAVAKLLQQIDDEVADVERRIREKERWEWRETVRKDRVDASTAATGRVIEGEEMELGGFGAVEFLKPDASLAEHEVVEHRVMGQVLVGAEEERAQLEELLERRRRLLGEA